MGRTIPSYRLASDREKRKWKITNGGGGAPLWNKDGTELFFTRRGDSAVAVWSVAVTSKPSFRIGAPTKLFEGSFFALDYESSLWRYGISSDGQRFIMNRGLYGGGVESRMDVVLNWSAELGDK